MSYFNPAANGDMQQLADGVAGLNVQEPARVSRKKRPNYAVHTDLLENVAPNGVAPQQFVAPNGQQFQSSVPAQQFQPPAQPFQPNAVPNQQSTPPVQPPVQSESDMLSIPVQRHTVEQDYKTTQFLTFQHACPPPAGTQYSVVDQGNASPKYIRTSMYNIPATKQMKNATGIPLGLVLRPFAPVQFGDKEVPQVDLRSIGGPPRCRRCRAYVNPAMQHTAKYTMVCNMCRFESPLDTEYAAPLDSAGIRTDYAQRPELHSGVVDFIVPPEYYLDDIPPTPLNHVFLIDISATAYDMQTQMATASAIRHVLYGSECGLPEGAKVCFIAYDKNLHFFNLDERLTQTTVCTVADIDDPFLPLHKGLFADPHESRHIIESTLLYIETMGEDKIPEPCYGAALSSALQALSVVGGGKVTACLSSLPSWGPGAIKPKLQGSTINADYIKTVVTAENPFFEALAKDYVKNNCGLDLFVVSRAPVDLANVGRVAVATGGSVKSWAEFTIDRDEKAYLTAFKDAVLHTTGYQGQLKVRCSSGLQASKYYGPFSSSGTHTDPLLPIVHENTSVACEFEYDGVLNTNQDAHFQAALLYTSADGVRKVRVVNAILSVSERIADVFAFADQDAVLALMLRECLSKMASVNYVTLKNRLTSQVVEIFARYRNLVAHHTSMPGQLVFPTGLKTLPTFILAAQKSKAFRERVPNPDSRVQALFDLSYSPTPLVSSLLYPQLVAVHQLEDSECVVDAETGFVNLPKTVPLTRNSLEFGGAYLMMKPTHFILWLHTDVNPLLLQDLFGDHISSLDQLDPSTFELPEINTHISLQLRNLCQYYARLFLDSDYVPVHVCRFKKDLNESEFVESLCEDQANDMTPAFADFLSQLHKLVNAKLESKSEKSELTNLNDGSALSQKFVHF